jgi:phosphoribosylanthranilate isomerase
MLKAGKMAAGQHVQIKMCGMTTKEDALLCASCGVHAVGFVFYPKSPRHVTGKQAGEIAASLPEEIQKIGVFVDENFSTIMKTVEIACLTGVQLHGLETPALVQRLRNEKLMVIKALFSKKAPGLETSEDYPASALLVECGKGALPGGNAQTWNWQEAKLLGNVHPLILAGGLSCDNVAVAIGQALPDAVDVCSGVESTPGRKDPDKVKGFVAAVAMAEENTSLRRIF